MTRKPGTAHQLRRIRLYSMLYKFCFCFESIQVAYTKPSLYNPIQPCRKNQVLNAYTSYTSWENRTTSAEAVAQISAKPQTRENRIRGRSPYENYALASSVRVLRFCTMPFASYSRRAFSNSKSSCARSLRRSDSI